VSLFAFLFFLNEISKQKENVIEMGT